MNTVLRAAIAATIATLATGVAHAQEVYVQGGTLGAGIGAAYSFNSWSGVHAEVEGFGLSHSFNVSDNKYDGHLSLKQGGSTLTCSRFPTVVFA